MAIETLNLIQHVRHIVQALPQESVVGIRATPPLIFLRSLLVKSLTVSLLSFSWPTFTWPFFAPVFFDFVTIVVTPFLRGDAEYTPFFL